MSVLQLLRKIAPQERKEITGQEILKWNIRKYYSPSGRRCPSLLLDRMELLGNEQILANESILRRIMKGTEKLDS